MIKKNTLTSLFKNTNHLQNIEEKGIIKANLKGVRYVLNIKTDLARVFFNCFDFKMDVPASKNLTSLEEIS